MSIRKIRVEPPRAWGELNLHELWSFRDLISILAARDIKLRYKQTALGVAWVILQPLVAALIFAVIFGWFAKLPSGNSPYLPFVFAGLLPWNFFSGAVQRAGNSLIADSKLITKVYFPRMLIPISSAVAVCLDFVVSLFVMLLILLVFQIPFTWRLLTIPLLLAATLVLATGVSLVVSALNVYYRDFMYALPFLLQVWMYATPIVYSTDIVPTPLHAVYALNPMVGIVDLFRWALLVDVTFPTLTLAVTLLLSVALVSIGLIVFQRIEHSLADVV